MTIAPLPGQSAAPLRARCMGDVLNVIPSLLGFHPCESLVVVMVDDGRVAVTARVDLAAVTSPVTAEVCFGALWERFPCASCIAVAYGSSETAWVALAALEEALPWGMAVRSAHVDGARWFTAPSDSGQSYDPTRSVMAAEAAFRGVRVLPDRASLASTLDAVVSPADMAASLAAVIALAPAETLAEGLRLLTEAMRRPQVLTPLEAATLAVAAHSPTFADVAVTAIDRGSVEPALALWTDVVRSTTEQVGACAAVILGLASWVSGNGAMLNVCLERAAPYAHETAWYRVLDLVRDIALPPSEWDAVRRDLLAG